MSNYRGGVGPELYYSARADGTALATFTTEASLMGGFPIPQIPATYFVSTGELASSMKIRAYGQLGSTTTGPTFTWSLRLLSSATAWTATGLAWSTNAATVSASLTGCYWQLDVDVWLKSIAAGAATSTLSAAGPVSSRGLSVPAFMPNDNVSSDVSTFDNTGATLYYLWLSAACGTSNAANTIKLLGLKIYLEN